MIFLKLGWVSVVCVFLTYFFMSIMFPTIFALGIFGLGRAGEEGLLVHRHGHHGRRHLPKVMGACGRPYDLSRGFIVPMLCFAFVAAYGFLWPKLSGAEGMQGVSTFARALRNGVMEQWSNDRNRTRNWDRTIATNPFLQHSISPIPMTPPLTWITKNWRTIRGSRKSALR